jgi:hypothetical protein
MANKRGAGAEPATTAEPAATKQSAPAKGARSGGETKPARTARSTKAAKPTAETASAGRGTRSRAGTSGGAAAGTDGRARRGTSGGSAGTTRGAKGRSSRSSADLKKDLRDFAGSRPDGWSHDDWLQFLDDLQSRGHNVNDRDAIGSMLERERLSLALERIPGVGPQRVKSIAEKYGYLWRLRETDADQLSREANVPRSVAEKVLDGLRR